MRTASMVVGFSSLLLGAAGCAGSNDNVWLLAYFRTPAEALHLAWSDDGSSWTALNDNQPVLQAMVGHRSVRDPFIRKGPDGWYHLLFTNSWKSHNCIYTRSRDLIHWEPQQLVPVMAGVPDAKNVWAPEFVYDPDRRDYLIFWSSVTTPADHQRIWCCRTKDFTRLSEPKVLFDPGYTVIDATLVRAGSTWVMAFKDERGHNGPDTGHKAMRIATARSLDGPYGHVSDLLTPHRTEGPAIFRADNRWLMLYDHFMEARWGAAESADLRHWTLIGQGLSIPPEARHGTVLPISRNELKRLQQAWLAPNP